MVSILVTMLLLIVISLIVLGFAQIARRNQRQSLDRQLSTQAFYAAETGINDVRDVIRQNINAGTTIAAKTDCDPASAAAYAPPTLNPTVDAANGISYSCILVDPTPSTLVYGSIDSTSTIVPLISASGGNITSVTMTWQSKGGSATPVTGCPTVVAGVFNAVSSWNCGYGIVRMDLVGTAGTLTQAGLQAGTMTSFLVPLNNVGSNSLGFVAGTANTNNRFGVKCSNTNCNLTITVPASTQYYLRLSTIYKGVSLQVTTTDASSNPLKLQGAQAVIDATGKAQDVLRRVQVHIPLTPSSTTQLPDYAIGSTDAVCKRFVTLDGFFQSFAATAVAGLTSITTPPNPMCQ